MQDLVVAAPMEPSALQFSATSRTGIGAQTPYTSLVIVELGGPRDENTTLDTATYQSTQAARFHQFFGKAPKFSCELAFGPEGP